TVSLTNGNSLLEWNTASEYNSHFFEIERSLDGVVFETIGLVDAAGFSTLAKNYFYTDHNVSELGSIKIFYRLRMVDLDNTFSYSAVRWVELDESNYSDGITIFPNPVSDELSITLYSTADQSASVQLIDISGRVIRKTENELVKGINFMPVQHLEDLASGVYFVQVISGRNFYTAKVVKE
ncbi:MAG: T9SS type A sorting domain-containing protein, partial [Chitinophagales bacterium]